MIVLFYRILTFNINKLCKIQTLKAEGLKTEEKKIVALR